MQSEAKFEVRDGEHDKVFKLDCPHTTVMMTLVKPIPVGELKVLEILVEEHRRGIKSGLQFNGCNCVKDILERYTLYD